LRDPSTPSATPTPSSTPAPTPSDSTPSGTSSSVTTSNTSRLVASVVRLANRTACAGGVGHHDHTAGEKNCCHRPGCYEQFVIPKSSPLKKFCDAFCRQALRCVTERERRLRDKCGG
jgi:hypothetical protein